MVGGSIPDSELRVKWREEGLDVAESSTAATTATLIELRPLRSA